MENTTIALRKETKELLDKLKLVPGESYDHVVMRLALKALQLEQTKESGKQ